MMGFVFFRKSDKVLFLLIKEVLSFILFVYVEEKRKGKGWYKRIRVI